MSAAYDDEALALLSNPGTVRRAHRLVAAGDVHTDGAETRVGDLTVAAGEGPPAAWRCPCRAPGVCVHIIAAAIARAAIGETSSQVPSAGANPYPSASDAADEKAPASDPRAELHALDAVALCRAAGIGAVRLARSLVEAEGFVAGLEADGPRLRIRTREGDVLFLAGSGLAGMVSGVAPERRVAVHLATVADVRRIDGIPWNWPAASDAVDVTAQTSERRDAATEAARQIELIVERGTGRVVGDTAARLSAAGTLARAVGLPSLSTELARCSGIAARFAERDDGIDDAALISALARAHVLASAIADHPLNTPLGVLRGRSRRDIGEAHARELLPLGVRWWAAATGARGMTAVFWDRAEHDIVQTRTARPAGVDPGFRADAGVPMLWGATIPNLLDGPFVLQQARLADDRELMPDGARLDRSVDTAFIGARSIDAPELDEIAVDRWRERRRGQSFTGEAKPMLLAPSSVGKVSIDEVDQHLIWPVTDADGDTIILRLPMDVRRTSASDALMRLTESRATIGWVLVHPLKVGGRTIFEPSTLFIRERARIRATALDFEPHAPAPADSARLVMLRDRLATVLRRRPKPETPTPVPSAPGTVVSLCRDVLDVVDDIVVTGRRALAPSHRTALSAAAQQADDLAMTLLASAVRAVIGAESRRPAALLRTRHLAERALFLIDGSGW